MKSEKNQDSLAADKEAGGSFLWSKGYDINAEIERFTVGRDRELDLLLAPYDVMGSMAHIIMLNSIGLIGDDELPLLLSELRAIHQVAMDGKFVIEEGIEDVHSQVELMLTRRLGDMGKKIHSGRSRNDQVLLDLKLFTRHELRLVAEAVADLFHQLIQKSNQHSQVLMPGYTHLQVAMPSSFGLWFGAHAESLCDDMPFLEAAWRTVNRNPLGSAAGYGSSFPLNRQMTTRLLGFDSMDYNVVYAQMGRGKMELGVGFAVASIAATLAKLAFDACLFNSQNFGFIRLPRECTTGSSIMPHKKNPDVFELIRAKCNKLQALPTQVTLIKNNLPTGYFRDLQIIKEVFLPAFDELLDCLRMTTYIINKIEVNEHILDDERYDPMFSVEEVNRLAAEGMPFRDAYKKVGLDIEAGRFKPCKDIHHTHEGSIGNLCNDRIEQLMAEAMSRFGFERVAEAEQALVRPSADRPMA
ncbi:MAG: argininosuccinate lyase [Prevotella sp.]|nr:argininosuccinate lyase [Prevotella sp.]